MDCSKIGRLIAGLRTEMGLTQKDVADGLGISNKTVSKWECGLGCPDLSLWPDLSAMLGADMNQLMDGEITPNRPDSGNIAKLRFYVCPSCGNILFSTGGASVFCCGRKLEPLTLAEGDLPHVTVQEVDFEYYVTIDHDMRKDHYLSFAAYVKSDGVYLHRFYPEQAAAVRLPYLRGGQLYFYCVRHGLYRSPLDFS